MFITRFVTPPQNILYMAEISFSAFPVRRHNTMYAEVEIALFQRKQNHSRDYLVHESIRRSSQYPRRLIHLFLRSSDIFRVGIKKPSHGRKILDIMT